METTPKHDTAVLPDPFLPDPVRPEDGECCGSECGDACIQTIYYQEKAAYDAQQLRLRAQAEAAKNEQES